MRKNCMRIIQLNMIYLELISSAIDNNVTLRSAMTYRIHTSLSIYFLLFTNILKHSKTILEATSIASNLYIIMRLNIQVRQFQYCALWARAPMDCNRKLNSQVFLPYQISNAVSQTLRSNYYRRRSDQGYVHILRIESYVGQTIDQSLTLSGVMEVHDWSISKTQYPGCVVCEHGPRICIK